MAATDRFFRVEALGAYQFGGDGVVPSSKFFAAQIVDLGVGLQSLLGTSAPDIATKGHPRSISRPLMSALPSSFASAGACEASFGSAFCTGDGFDFVLASGWNLNTRYLYAMFGNADSPNPGTTVKSESLVLFELNKGLN
jgi:hypothetical protein